MSRSEEMIAVLWIIAAILSFGFGFNVWGYLFAIKGLCDTVISIYFAIKEKP